jgi:putative peptidoglycan lipid II flippase
MALLRSASTVAAMTMISRVLGFVRDMLMASVIGTGQVADAFVVAFRFPNLFRRLFAEVRIQCRVRSAVCPSP